MRIRPVGRAVACALACLLLAQLAACGGATSSEPEGRGEDEPASVAPIVEEAEQLRERGDYGGAIEAYERVLERTPWNRRVQHTLAMTHADRATRWREQRSLPSAERDLRRALELAPDDPRVRHNLAVVLVERSALELDPERAAAQRAEAGELDAGVAVSQPERDAGLERRLDLAFELLERGQLEAGIARLEELRRSHPTSAEVNRLLGQALVRQGSELSQRGNHTQAGRTLDRAVAAYARVPGCRAPEWTGCSRDEARIAHYNRVVAWLMAGERTEARRALDEAEDVGLSFPELRESAVPASRGALRSAAS